MSQLFISGGQVLEFQLQHQSFQWTPRTDLLYDGLVGSPCSPRDSQESYPTPQFLSISLINCKKKNRWEIWETCIIPSCTDCWRYMFRFCKVHNIKPWFEEAGAVLLRNSFSLACFKVRIAQKTRSLPCEKGRKHPKPRRKRTPGGIKWCFACLGNIGRLSAIQIMPCRNQVECWSNGKHNTKFETELQKGCKWH